MSLNAKTTANCVPDFLDPENQPRAFSRRDRTANRKMSLLMCGCAHVPASEKKSVHNKISTFATKTVYFGEKLSNRIQQNRKINRASKIRVSGKFSIGGRTVSGARAHSFSVSRVFAFTPRSKKRVAVVFGFNCALSLLSSMN
jgi:hypothetical protein